MNTAALGVVFGLGVVGRAAIAINVAIYCGRAHLMWLRNAHSAERRWKAMSVSQLTSVGFWFANRSMNRSVNRSWSPSAVVRCHDSFVPCRHFHLVEIRPSRSAAAARHRCPQVLRHRLRPLRPRPGAGGRPHEPAGVSGRAHQAPRVSLVVLQPEHRWSSCNQNIAGCLATVASLVVLQP